MRTKTRERAVRLVLASLMNSDLSIRELREIADGLAGHSFAWELGSALYEATKHLANYETSKQRHSDADELEELAYGIVQRRRLSKRNLLELLNIVSPNWKQSKSDAPVRQMLREFFSSAPQREINDLMEMLQGPKPPDAYLKGIVNR